jgi:hypothetical protein
MQTEKGESNFLRHPALERRGRIAINLESEYQTTVSCFSCARLRVAQTANEHDIHHCR